MFSDHESARKYCRVSAAGSSSTPPPQFIVNFDQGCPKQQFKQQDRNDDADRPALERIGHYDLHRRSSRPRDQQAFPYPTQDEFDHRGSNGRTHSKGVSGAAH